MPIISEESLKMKLETAYMCFIIKGVLIIEEFFKQKAIEDYFTYLDR